MGIVDISGEASTEPQTPGVWGSSELVLKMAAASPKAPKRSTADPTQHNEPPGFSGAQSHQRFQGFQRFLVLLSQLKWPKEEIHLEVLKAIRDATPKIQAMLVEDIETCHKEGRVSTVSRSIERSRFIANRLRKVGGEAPRNLEDKG